MTTSRYLMHSMLALTALLWVVPAQAAKKARAANNGTSTADVLTKIHATNQKEIQASKYAEKHAKSKDVIEFAKTLVKDHTEADEKVMDFAKKHNIDLGMTAAGVTATNKKDLGHLADVAKGDQFDNHFVQMMLEDHKRAIRELTQARDASDDSDLKDLIDEVLPTLKDHQKTAEELMDSARI